jgi:hypothetical protein
MYLRHFLVGLRPVIILHHSIDFSSEEVLNFYKRRDGIVTWVERVKGHGENIE